MGPGITPLFGEAADKGSMQSSTGQSSVVPPYTSLRIFKTYVEWRLKRGRRLRPWINQRPTQLLLDGTFAAIALLGAYILRFDGQVPLEFSRFMWFWAVMLALAWPIALATRGGYRATWQHFGTNDLRRLVLRALPLSAFLLIVRALTPGKGVIPYTVVLMDLGLMLLFSCSVRMLRRFDHESMRRLCVPSDTVLIANERTVAGAIRQLRSGGGVRLIGILASEPELRRRNIDGIPVLGTPDSLAEIIATKAIKVVILSSADLECISTVLRITAQFDISVRILPSAEDLLADRVQVTKRVSVQDLELSRNHDQTRPHPRVEECFKNRVVLITGAGGSIGSELSRQVAKMPVRKLLLLDQDENSIFELLNGLKHCTNLVPIVADIRDKDAIDQLFDRHRPHVVLHAAAYKHVPIMELNPCEAVLNNVRGTRILAEKAIQYACERMVMISSDKAVQPSSVMGATKRLAELVIGNAYAVQPRRATRFACVRFGNVLGSRGSVLPLFLKQIEAGGPVTVTNKEMTRYFMTIPEAVRLVLQATTLADCGDVFMLDMGDPVSIMSFAESVIQSSGLALNKDIKIAVTGTRPGEKLHERLWSEHAQISETEFPQVRRVQSTPADRDFSVKCQRLEQAARLRQVDTVRAMLLELPIEYRTDKDDARVYVENECAASAYGPRTPMVRTFPTVGMGSAAH